MKIGATLTGDSLVDGMAAETKRLEVGIARAVATATRATQLGLRAEATAALGVGVGNAWRSLVYPPRKGAPPGSGEPSARPAGLIWSKARTIVAAFDAGVTIVPRWGKWLAIPTPNVPKGPKGKHLYPYDFEDRSGLKLVFIPGNGRRAYLALDRNSANSGRRGRSTAIRATAQFRFNSGGEIARGRLLVMYILVRRVRLPKLLSVARHADGGQLALNVALGAELGKAA